MEQNIYSYQQRENVLSQQLIKCPLRSDSNNYIIVPTKEFTQDNKIIYISLPVEIDINSNYIKSKYNLI